jgi:hypothetical protein
LLCRIMPRIGVGERGRFYRRIVWKNGVDAIVLF